MPDATTFVATVPGGQLVGTVGGAGPDVLALHGGPGLECSYLDGVVDELRGGYRVATYQQRGLAPSTTSGPFSVDQEVADVVDVLDALGLERAWLAGHSWGGHLALHVAVAHPERLEGAVIVDPLGAVGDGGASEMSATMEARLAALGPRAGGEPMTGLARVWPAYFADPTSPPPMPHLASSAASQEGIWPTIVAAMPSLADRLTSCTVPMAFVACALSPIPPEACRATAELVSSARFELVAGAGHFPWVERPGSVRGALDRLVSSRRG